MPLLRSDPHHGVSGGQRAEAAHKELLELFEHDVAPLGAAPGGAEHIAAFRANLVISVHLLDLASVQSTLAFADEVTHTSEVGN